MELAEAYPALFSVSSLKKSRMADGVISGPPYFRNGRKVAYARNDVDAWIAGLKNRRDSQSRKTKASVVRLGRPSKEEQIARRTSAG